MLGTALSVLRLDALLLSNAIHALRSKTKLKMALVHDFPKLKKTNYPYMLRTFFFLREYMLRTWL